MFNRIELKLKVIMATHESKSDDTSRDGNLSFSIGAFDRSSERAMTSLNTVATKRNLDLSEKKRGLFIAHRCSTRRAAKVANGRWAASTDWFFCSERYSHHRIQLFKSLPKAANGQVNHGISERIP